MKKTALILMGGRGEGFRSRSRSYTDGDFFNTDLPNPENPKSFSKALILAEKEDAELVLATAPDCDRMGARICEKYGVERESTLTGFKYIGNKIREYDGKKTFLFLSVRTEKSYLQSHFTLPKSNVLKFCLEEGSWVVVRPSGNEPKLKYHKNLIRNKPKKYE